MRALLVRRAAEQPDHEFLLFDGDQRWTFSETLARVERFAAGLRAQGVRQGDFVLSWQGNSPAAVTTFLSVNFLGAVYVPINTGYRGALLEHVIRNSGARVMIADGALLDRLGVIARRSSRRSSSSATSARRSKASARSASRPARAAN